MKEDVLNPDQELGTRPISWEAFANLGSKDRESHQLRAFAANQL